MFVPKVSIRSVDKEIEDFCLNIVEQTIKYRENSNFTRKDFLQLMIELKNEGKIKESSDINDEKVESSTRKMKNSEIAAQVFVFIIAGR